MQLHARLRRSPSHTGSLRVVVSGEKRVARLSAKSAADNSFENIAEECLEMSVSGWTRKQLIKEQARLKNHAHPWIWRLPIANNGVAEIRPLLTRLVKRDHVEQACRLREESSRIFRFAVATGRLVHARSRCVHSSAPCRSILSPCSR